MTHLDLTAHAHKYDVVYADPPWPMYGSATKNAAAGKHYDLMTMEEVCAIDMRSLLRDPKHGAFFVWATCPRLNLAMKAGEGCDGGVCPTRTACTPGRIRCGGDVLMRCNADGTGFENEPLSDVATFCGDGTCLRDADCGPGWECPRPDTDTTGMCRVICDSGEAGCDGADASTGQVPDP